MRGGGVQSSAVERENGVCGFLPSPGQLVCQSHMDGSESEIGIGIEGEK